VQIAHGIDPVGRIDDPAAPDDGGLLRAHRTLRPAQR
jgi:hypothetical protein